MADLTLTLGRVAFHGFEVPERISGLGGDQMLTVHKLLGGERVVDAMGRDDAPVAWSGRFRGQNAVARARTVDAMRVSGDQQELTFGDFTLSVVVERFTYDFERFYEVPYAISLLVVSDNSSPGVASDATPGVGEMLTSDLSSSLSLATNIGDTVVSGHLARLQGVMATVGDFTGASFAVRQNLLAPIRDAQARVNDLIATAENTALQGESAIRGLLS